MTGSLLLFRLLTSFLVISLPVFSADCELRGTVRAKATGQPLAGVAVTLPELTRVAATGERGEYHFNGLPAGHHRIEFAIPGYKKVVLELKLSSGEFISAPDVELEALFGDLVEEVRVTGRRADDPIESVSRFTLKPGEMTQLAGAIEDLGRLLNFFPSIGQVDLLSNDLVVRGGSPLENGYYIDNIPVFDINHFKLEGAGGGVVGIINPALIAETDFYVGAFPARYGDRLSSIIDIRFRQGAMDRTHFKADLNAGGFSLASEGPMLKKKGSYILSLRRSYLDILASLFSKDQIVPRYGDIHLKADWQPGEKDKLTFLSILADSTAAYDLETALKASDLGTNFYMEHQTVVLTSGLNWSRTWNDHVKSDLSLSFSRLSKDVTLNRIDTASLLDARDEQETRLVLRSVNNWAIDPRHILEFGGELVHEDSDFYNYFATSLDRWGELFPGFTLQGRYKTIKSSGFFVWHWTVLSRMTLSLGGRLDYFSFNRSATFSPRFTLSWELSSQLTLKGAVGLHYQHLYAQLLARNPDTRHLRTPRALHLVLGGEYRPDRRTLLTLELYHKDYRNFPLTPDDPVLFVVDNGVGLAGFQYFNHIIDSGLASTFGIELFLHRYLTEQLYIMCSTSLFRSRYRDLLGQWRDRYTDNRLIVNLALGYTLDRRWKASVRWNYAGGPPYTPFDEERSRELDFGIIDADRIMAERYPPFHALHIRVDRQFKLKNNDLFVYINLLNVYNRSNVGSYFWSIHKRSVDQVYQAKFLPVIGLQVNF